MNYLMFMLPALLFALWAQFQVKSAFARGQQVPATSGVTGAQAASQILSAKGLENVRIEQTGGFLGDHYDPSSKVLRLSSDVFNGRSLAALGVAAHEAGHAIQDAGGYAPLAIRNGIVPLASVGSNLSFVLILIGFLIGSMGLALLGVVLFSLVVIFQLINLPVEYNASSRARQVLVGTGLISPPEEKVVANVLDAAALTYVAATVGSILTLLYYLVQLGIFGRRSD
jgi:uncharacterized protein